LSDGTKGGKIFSRPPEAHHNSPPDAEHTCLPHDSRHTCRQPAGQVLIPPVGGCQKRATMHTLRASRVLGILAPSIAAQPVRMGSAPRCKRGGSAHRWRRRGTDRGISALVGARSETSNADLAAEPFLQGGWYHMTQGMRSRAWRHEVSSHSITAACVSNVLKSATATLTPYRR